MTLVRALALPPRHRRDRLDRRRGSGVRWWVLRSHPQLDTAREWTGSDCLARHARRDVRVWIEPVAKQIDAIDAIDELYRFDRFAAPAELWHDPRARFPELLNAA